MAKGRVKRYKNGYADPRQFRSENTRVFSPGGIFLEAQSPNSTVTPLYTLKEFDDEERNLPSAYRIYMDCVDEYEAAMRIVGSTRFWDRLCRNAWFIEPTRTNPIPGFDGLISWRQDKLAQQQSRVRRLLLDAAEEGDMASAKKIFDECKPANSKGASFRNNEVVRRAAKKKDPASAKIIEMHNRAMKDG